MKVRLSRIRAAAAFRPAGYYEDVTSAGQVAGAWLILTREAYQSLRAKYSPFGPGVRIRNPNEQAIGLSICATCAELTADGRCRVCRSCGGLRRVADWVRLSSHDCPKGLWPK